MIYIIMTLYDYIIWIIQYCIKYYKSQSIMYTLPTYTWCAEDNVPACSILLTTRRRRRRLKRRRKISYFCDHRNVTPAVCNGHTRLKQSLLRPVKKRRNPYNLIYRYNNIMNSQHCTHVRKSTVHTKSMIISDNIIYDILYDNNTVPNH